MEILGIISCVTISYPIGWVIAAIILAHKMISEEPFPKSFDYAIAGVWGMMGATIWPLLLVGFIVGKLVSGNNQSD